MSMLPNDSTARKIINDAIKEAVGSKLRQDAEKDLQSSIGETVEDKTGMPKAEFNKRVALRYKQETKFEKYLEDKEWAEVAFEENEILANK